MSDTPAFHGACNCGAFSWSASGAPEFSGYCHCSHCRRMSGAGRTPFMGFPQDSVSMTGPTAVFRDSSGKGGGIDRHFCPTCGSRLFSVPGSAPAYRIFYAGSLADPDLFRPEVSIHIASQVSWAPAEADLASFHEDVSS